MRFAKRGKRFVGVKKILKKIGMNPGGWAPRPFPKNLLFSIAFAETFARHWMPSGKLRGANLGVMLLELNYRRKKKKRNGRGNPEQNQNAGKQPIPGTGT